MRFDLSGLTADQRVTCEQALAECDFPWDRVAYDRVEVRIDPGLQWQGSVVPGGPITLGNISGDWLKEVFLNEAAHIVDYGHLDWSKRRAIFDVLHPPGISEDHYHDPGNFWWAGDYEDKPAEAWMPGFRAAYAATTYRTDLFFTHTVTPEVGGRLRAIVTPDLPPLVTPPDSHIHRHRHRIRRHRHRHPVGGHHPVRRG